MDDELLLETLAEVNKTLRTMTGFHEETKRLLEAIVGRLEALDARMQALEPPSGDG